ncbi:inner centromere protein-like [Lytechinus variegatus]|uniref:inner centromere protein-like n=1 Tax=Lytechinus variegatus TaxID=7654 RepID=UPI001BB25009|nr:inner centromere protein-like [Lytechinus variegatus]XP_041469423.1 inner centromere protein-like [Lytechinus variegatus]
MRVDPEKKALQAERARKYRQGLSEGERQRQRELARLRQQRFRERKKCQSRLPHPAEALKVKLPIRTSSKKDSVSKATRSSVEARRAYWRERKQAERQRLKEKEPQKLRRIREKDRKQKREKREMQKKVASSRRSNCASQNPFYNQNTFYNHVSKARKSLPESQRKFAQVIKALLKNTSPRKQAALEKEGIQWSTSPQLSPRELKLLHRKSALTLARRVLAKKKKPGRKLPRHVVEKVQSFYKRGDISRMLPHKRYATKRDGAAYVMQMTLKRAFQTFSKDSPRCKISFAAFAKLRPRSVRLFSRNFHDTCLCVYIYIGDG